MDPDLSLTQRGLHHLLTEMFDGGAAEFSWVLNPGDAGLIGALGALSAESASRRPGPTRNSIAGHANHLRYSLELLNRWANGEENPFASADWAGSWRVQEVDEAGWRDLVRRLDAEGRAWIAAAQQPREWDEISLTGALASAAHLAYHLGAIRQLAAMAKEDPPEA